MEILAQSSTAFVLTHNFQGTHILGASRGHLSDSVASCIFMHHKFLVVKVKKWLKSPYIREVILDHYVKKVCMFVCHMPGNTMNLSQSRLAAAADDVDDDDDDDDWDSPDDSLHY